VKKHDYFKLVSAVKKVAWLRVLLFTEDVFLTRIKAANQDDNENR